MVIASACEGVRLRVNVTKLGIDSDIIFCVLAHVTCLLGSYEKSRVRVRDYKKGKLVKPTSQTRQGTFGKARLLPGVAAFIQHLVG